MRQNNAIARNTVESAVKAAWAAASPGYDLNPENHLKTKAAEEAADYALSFVRPASNNTRALGNDGDYIRGNGVVIIQIFLRRGSGTVAAQAAADLLDQLSNTEALPVTFGTSTNSTMRVKFRQTGPAIATGSDPSWSQWNIVIPYFWDCDDAKNFTNVLP